MRAVPARAQDPRDFSRPDAPVDPRERHAAEKEDEEGRGKQVFHVDSRSRAAVI